MKKLNNSKNRDLEKSEMTKIIKELYVKDDQSKQIIENLQLQLTKLKDEQNSRTQATNLRLHQYLLKKVMLDVYVYLKYNSWKRIGFNRIREKINSQYSDKLISEMVQVNPGVFIIIDLTDSSDPKGLLLNSDLTLDDLINE